MDTITQNFGPNLADQLAAACGAGDLAAAAAIDAEEGDRFLHARLADQMAGAHLLTMRMAALADRAITAAAEDGGQGTGNLSLFDLAAARFAGAAARLNGRYCRALQTSRAVGGSAAEDDEVEWVGYSGLYDDELTPEERARRINRMKFYRKLNSADDKPSRKSKRASVTAAEQARLSAAEAAALHLLRETGTDTLAGPSNALRTRLFTDQLAATHRLVLRLTGRADTVIAAAEDPLDRPEGLRLTYGAARLMERFRQGVAMLHRLRTTPDGPRRRDIYFSGELGDGELEAERAEDIAHGLDPDTGLPMDPKPAAQAPTPILLRRGRLKNGNPGGDFLAAPRCGAKARSGCACRQPAMANGRCRFHGGKSTGPRTEAGRARARANRLVHGLRSAEVIALSAAAAAAHRSLGLLLATARQRTETRMQKSERDAAPPLGHLLASDFCLLASAPAGHGVDRSESSTAAGGAAILPFAGTRNRRRPSPYPSPASGRGDWNGASNTVESPLPLAGEG